MSQRTHNPGLLFTLWTVRYSLEQSRQTTGSWAPRVCGEVRRPVEVDSEHPTIPSVPCTPKGRQEPDLAQHPPATGGVAKGTDWLLPNLCPPTAGCGCSFPGPPSPIIAVPVFSEGKGLVPATRGFTAVAAPSAVQGCPSGRRGRSSLLSWSPRVSAGPGDQEHSAVSTGLHGRSWTSRKARKEGPRCRGP